MGLDAVELVMEVEDHFGFSIRDAEAGGVRTVGDLAAIIQSRIEAARSAICPTLSAFLRLRSCAGEVTSNDQLRIRTKTPVITTLSPSQRRRLWKRLHEISGAWQPALRRPQFLRRMLVGSALLLFVGAVVSAGVIDWAILPLTLTLAALLSVILHFATVLFRTVPPRGMETFGGIARRMAGSKVATKQLHLSTFDEIVGELRPIVAKALGIDAAQVVAEARFVEDLGME